MTKSVNQEKERRKYQKIINSFIYHRTKVPKTFIKSKTVRTPNIEMGQKKSAKSKEGKVWPLLALLNSSLLALCWLLIWWWGAQIAAIISTQTGSKVHYCNINIESFSTTLENTFFCQQMRNSYLNNRPSCWVNEMLSEGVQKK